MRCEWGVGTGVEREWGHEEDWSQEQKRGSGGSCGIQVYVAKLGKVNSGKIGKRKKLNAHGS